MFNPYSEPQADPLASLANPAVPTGTCPKVLVEPNQTVSRSPGCYKGRKLKENVTLEPGTYVIDADSFYASSNSVISCTSCTVILTSSTASSNPSSIGNATIDGGAKLNLVAPPSGEYAGILFYQDLRAPLLNVSTVSGHGEGKFEGAIYMPQASLTFTDRQHRVPAGCR